MGDEIDTERFVKDFDAAIHATSTAGSVLPEQEFTFLGRLFKRIGTVLFGADSPVKDKLFPIHILPSARHGHPVSSHQNCIMVQAQDNGHFYFIDCHEKVCPSRFDSVWPEGNGGAMMTDNELVRRIVAIGGSLRQVEIIREALQRDRDERARLEARRRMRADEADRRSALDKLTPRERELLGLETVAMSAKLPDGRAISHSLQWAQLSPGEQAAAEKRVADHESASHAGRKPPGDPVND